MPRRIVAALLGLALGACATPPATDWFLENEAELQGRRTFTVAPIQAKPGDWVDVSKAEWDGRQQLIRQRIRRDLTAKGYRETESNPDFRIDWVARIQLKSDFWTYTEGEREGEIDVRAVDPATGRWIWHGWATKTLTQKLDHEAVVQQAVSLILARFPPAS